MDSSIHNWGELFLQVLERLPVTIFMLVASLIVGLILGTFIAIIRIKQFPVLHQLMAVFISFSRCTPLLVQLFLIYFGLPQLLSFFGIYINDVTPLIFAIATFALHISAYLAEVIRSAYLAVGEGQLEACYSVGMTYQQALRRVILPQAFVLALPNMGNTIIELLKDTTLAFTIGVIDIMGQVRLIIGNNYGLGLFQVYVVISIVYWATCAAIEVMIHQLEKRFKKGHINVAKA
ncbi:amino acid ABC transporter permease [Bacillus sp. AGMB 02131]|uniref:Amino acid ABC transporter permease n=1 Tax=Peribacillus faecalis TaxID=2772559 RepID=A0A927CU10_9BACI|nr:amino acid ABC transporter permease [Peribacillus faecalis]MBD3107548.1 amino acid ABC transporter permease [Peribacillus faecalis]